MTFGPAATGMVGGLPVRPGLMHAVEPGAEPAGDESWVLGTIQGSAGRETIVLADAALKRIDHPFADHHVEIGVVLEGPGGLPDDAEAAALNAEEDDLVARLRGVAVYAGRTTAPGLRAMHFVAEDPELMRPAIDAWAEGLPPAEFKDQLRWFAREVMPAFAGRR